MLERPCISWMESRRKFNRVITVFEKYLKSVLKTRAYKAPAYQIPSLKERNPYSRSESFNQDPSYRQMGSQKEDHE